MLSAKGNATRIMFNAIIEESLDRIKQWFDEHPNEPYCYWAKDKFIAIEDKDNAEILECHPEIEDINDHTIVQWNKEAEVVRLSRFCPKLREGLADMYENGVISGKKNDYHWALFKDGDNFEVLGYRK